jgi:hypothetical protein
MVNPVNRVHGPWIGGAIRSTVDQRRRGHEAWQCFTGARRVSIPGHRCSPALVGESEEGEANLDECLPEHERWRSGGMTATEDGGGELLIA